jgi:acyl carrier protein
LLKGKGSAVDRESIFEILLRYINEFAGRDYQPTDIDRSRSPADYGVDSLNVLQVLTEIESALGIEIDLGQISQSDFASIESILDYLDAIRIEDKASEGPTTR